MCLSAFSQVTLSVAKRPFGDEFVEQSVVSHAPCGEVPWQLQQLRLPEAGIASSHLDPRLTTPQSTWTTNFNTRPLPSPPGVHLFFAIIISCCHTQVHN